MLSDRTLAVTGMRPEAIATWGDAVRAISTAMVVLVMAGLTVVYGQTLRNTIAIRGLQDFGVFYASAAHARAGAELYTDGLESRTPAPPANLNPPHFHLLLLPLTALAPAAAFWTWMAVSGVALIASLAIVAKCLHLGRWGIVSLGAITYASPAMFATLMTGQVGAVLLLPYTLAWRHARRGQETAAAVWLGICACAKPLFLFFALADARLGRWRRAMALVLTTLACFAVGIASFGIASHGRWLQNLAGVTWAEHYMNASLLGLVERCLSASEWPQQPILSAARLIAPVWTIAAAAVAGATLWRLPRVADVDRQFLLVTSAALLISPVSWIYYLWLLIPPMCAHFASLSATEPRMRRLLLVSSAGMLVPPPLVLAALTWGAGVGTLTVGSIYSWALIGIWFAAWRDPDAT